jgi:hypothetical protein
METLIYRETPMKRKMNPRFRTLYRSVVACGLALIAFALYRMILDPSVVLWIILALLAVLTGSFSLKIPGINGRVSAGDTITCLSTLLLGPYAGALTAAVDALGGSFRCSTPARRLQFILYNSANSAISAFLAGLLALRFLGQPILHREALLRPASLLLPLCLLAGGYFLLNTVLVAAAAAFDKSLSFFLVWREGFMWTCVNYLAGAFVAGMLAQAADPLAPTRLLTVLFCCAAVYLSCRAHVRLAHKVQRLQQSAQPAAGPGQNMNPAAA